MRKMTWTEQSSSPQISHQLLWDQTGPARREASDCSGWFTGCQVGQVLLKNGIVRVAFCITQPCSLVGGCRRSVLSPHSALFIAAALWYLPITLHSDIAQNMCFHRYENLRTGFNSIFAMRFACFVQMIIPIRIQNSNLLFLFYRQALLSSIMPV